MTHDLMPEPDPSAPARPGHRRLSPETWDLVLEDYLGGARPARVVAAEFGVTESALRKQATRRKMTRREQGDRHVLDRAAGKEAEARRTHRTVRRLFEGIEGLDDQDADDPALLMRQAARAAGRAMRQRLWVEAKTLAELAAHYGKLAAQVRAIDNDHGTVETLPLKTLVDVYLASDDRVAARFEIDDRPGALDPDRDMKSAVRKMKAAEDQIQAAAFGERLALRAHADRLEAMLREAGMEPPARPATPALQIDI